MSLSMYEIISKLILFKIDEIVISWPLSLRLFLGFVLNLVLPTLMIRIIILN